MAEYIDKAILLDHLDIENALGGHYGISLTEINKIPAADVRPVVKATWKRIDYNPCGHDYKCSSCGWKNDMETHYCPDCGALMEES